MKLDMELVRKVVWKFRQPLTRTPDVIGAAVSDLFIWRHSEDWKTYFELTDIAGLFVQNDRSPERTATFLFFDDTGILFHKESIELVPNERNSLDLSEFTTRADCSFGSFCVFHSHTPGVISDLGSFLSERGYVSYSYKGAAVRSYVHGNLDAIACLPNQKLQMLGAGSLLMREYRLQYELEGPTEYEIAVVNSSSCNQIISCYALSISDARVLDQQKVKLRPKASTLFRFNVKESHPYRIVVKSNLVMARPLVFRFDQQQLDVFHG